MLFSTMIMTAALTGGATEEGFTSLFDGKSLNGWTIVGKRGPGYVPQDGIIVCPANGGGNLFTEKTYSDFIFRFEFKLSPGGNNGVGIRTPLQGNAAYVGMEIQLLDDPAPQYKNLRPVQYCGSIYDVFAAKRGSLKPAGEWNSMEIHCDGPQVTITINDQVIVDADTSTVTDEAVLEKHPGLKRTEGHIGFLGHGTLVAFRNLRVKELP